jgi:transposase
LFYYFRIEDHIPDDHLLRLVDRHVDFAFVRENLKATYSHTGRPSIDPEVLLRILLIGYLYGITSERRLVEDVGMHLAYRWFTGLGFDQEVPHHSTFSKNRHGRFQESSLFLELFERIVQQCMNVGLLRGVDLSVDSTQIRADASPDRTITREQLPEVAKVNRTLRDCRRSPGRKNDALSQMAEQVSARNGFAPRTDWSSTEFPSAPRALDSLQKQLRLQASFFRSKYGRLIRSLLAESESDEQLAHAFRVRWICPRRQGVIRILRMAIQEGHLRPNLDLETATDMLYGPLYYRLILGAGPIDGAFTDGLFEQFLIGHQPHRAKRSTAAAPPQKARK